MWNALNNKRMHLKGVTNEIKITSDLVVLKEINMHGRFTKASIKYTCHGYF